MVTKRAGTNSGWRDYWKEDRDESCIPEDPATAQEVAQHWVEYFSELRNDSRILDIATGNGILLVHAAAAAENVGKDFSLTGVDLADIDPVRYVSGLPVALRQAEFVGRTAAEELPFSDASFDVVVSQYGLEYAGLEAALAEVERVLVSGGQLQWLAHGAESAVVAQNRDQSRQVDFLLASESPLQAMRQLVGEVKERGSVQHAMSELGTSLRKAEDYCRDNPPAAVVQDVCTKIAHAAPRWQAYDPDDLVNMLDDSKHRLAAHQQRINDLLAAVLTPEREEIVRKKLQTSNWQAPTFSTLCVGTESSPIGTTISALRTKETA